MASCSREHHFKRYYPFNFVFTKPEYFYDDEYDNMELQDIMETSRNNFNKSPKKENRQPGGNGLTRVEKSKRGSYNFNQNQATNSSFITRDDMQPVKQKEGPRNRKPEEKIVWTLPKWKLD